MWLLISSGVEWDRDVAGKNSTYVTKTFVRSASRSLQIYQRSESRSAEPGLHRMTFPTSAV